MGVGRRPVPQGPPEVRGTPGQPGGHHGSAGGGHVPAVGRPGLAAEVGRRGARAHRQAEGAPGGDEGHGTEKYVTGDPLSAPWVR